MDYIRRTYGVPAKRGMRVAFAPAADFTEPAWDGVIVGSRAAYLRVKIMWAPGSWACYIGRVFLAHPTYRIGYDVPSAHTKKEA